MKILIHSHFFLPSVGGVERLVAAMAAAFAEKGHVVTVASETAAGSFDDGGFSYRVVRRPGAVALARLMREHDVVHLAGPALFPMLLGSLLGKPVVVEHHMYQAICPNGLLVFQPDRTVCPGHFLAGRHRECLRCNAALGKWKSFRMWLLGFPRLWLARRVAANVAITEHVDRRLGLPRSRMIYHGVREPASATEPASGAAEPNAPVCFAYVGRFVREKGLPVLIDAAARLKRQGAPFRLKLIGDGPERANLEAAVRDRELRDSAAFTGMLGPEDLRRETADAKALIVPSLWEELCPLAPIEQMMRGKALIVSRIGGLSEVVGDAGLQFPPGDAQALASCMLRVIEEPALARQLGESARRRALALFRQDDMISAHLRLYRDVCAPTASPAGREDARP